MPSQADDRIERLDESLEEARDELAHVRARRASARARATQVESDIDVAKGSFERQVEELDRRIGESEVAGELAQLRSLREQRAQIADAYHERLTTLEAALGETRALLTELDEREPMLAEKVAALQQEMAQARGAVHTTKQLEEAEELRGRLAELEADRVQLAKEIEESRPAVEAYRRAVSGSGAEALAGAYEEQAERHGEQWRLWLKWLVAAILTSIVLGVTTILIGQPDTDASTSETISALALDTLVLGLLLYVVRLTASQFRVHRHLEAVAYSKAAALDTFSRIVAGPSDPDARAAVAVALAQAIFTPDATGFIEPNQDHVTLVERVVGPALQRGNA